MAKKVNVDSSLLPEFPHTFCKRVGSLFKIMKYGAVTMFPLLVHLGKEENSGSPSGIADYSGVHLG